MFRFKLAVLAVLWTSVLSAQTITGSITGAVSDPSGAVVANVKIVATNTGTNLTFPTTTNDTGVYNLVFLPHIAPTQFLIQNSLVLSFFPEKPASNKIYPSPYPISLKCSVLLFLLQVLMIS